MPQLASLRGRRSFLSLVSGVVAFACIGGSGTGKAETLAPAYQGALRFHAIRVDASALATRGLQDYARRVETLVMARAQGVFAGNIAPSDRHAAILILRISSLSLNSAGGMSRRRGGSRSADATDYLEGEGIVLSPSGVVTGRFPVLSALSANYGDSDQRFGDDRNRISNIGWHFASWVHRNMGL